MSASGQSLSINSALAQPYVRCAPNNDQTFCVAANDAERHKRTNAAQQTELLDHLIGA